MKKYIFLFVSFLFLIACFQDERHLGNHSEKTNLQNTVLNTDTLNDICEQLAVEYRNSALLQPPITLQEKVDLLDSIALKNSAFIGLKPSHYVKITAAEAAVFLTDVESGFDDLNVSPSMEAYFNIIVDKDYRSSALRSDIENDMQLTSQEKSTLYFILDRVGYSSDDDDPLWDKQNIVAITIGYQSSPAQAVFNAALISVHKE